MWATRRNSQNKVKVQGDKCILGLNFVDFYFKSTVVLPSWWSNSAILTAALHESSRQRIIQKKSAKCYPKVHLSHCIKRLHFVVLDLWESAVFHNHILFATNIPSFSHGGKSSERSGRRGARGCSWWSTRRPWRRSGWQFNRIFLARKMAQYRRENWPEVPFEKDVFINYQNRPELFPIEWHPEKWPKK